MKPRNRKSAASTPLSAREIALRVLERSGIGTPVQSLLDTILKGGDFARQEASLATELAYGYLRSEIQLSWLLGQFLKAPEKLPLAMRIILGIAAYELLYLDRIPAHASVNAAVEAVRTRFGQGLSRVANGVLRSLIRHTEDEDVLAPLYYAKRIPDPLQRLSIRYSLPVWILELWINAYGQERTEAYAAASAKVPWPCVRINTSRHDWTVLRGQLAQAGKSFALSGVRFAPGHAPEELHSWLVQGALSLQGAGSQLVLEALDVQNWQDPVWDACAGRGGKTLALMEQGLSILAASDVYLPRLRGLHTDARRLELSPPPLICTSATAPAIKGKPQTILLDVPCSGLGTLARHPDLRMLRTPDQIRGLVSLQEQILDTAWAILPSGGHIAYVTCTINPEENETQVSRFLERHPEGVLERQWASTPDDFGSDLMYGALIGKP